MNFDPPNADTGETRLLGLSHEELTALGAIHTVTEIVQQPAKWRELAQMLRARKAEIQAYLAAPFAHEDLVIAFCGAGTSGFAGGIVAAEAMTGGPHYAVAVSTTDLVDNHACFLDPRRPSLLVSFARSGDSPESVMATRIVDRHFKKAWHVIVTCNENGKLAQLARAENRLCLVMPEGTNDLGFAMTSSFSSMVIAALAIFGPGDFEANLTKIAQTADLAQSVIDRSAWIRDLANEDHDRAIYLGSGALRPAAAEGALKLLELTDGQIVTNSESPLAFRHGPKAIINAEKTLVIGYANSRKPSSCYSLDMLTEIQADGKADVVALGLEGISVAGQMRGFAINTGSPDLTDGWLAVAYVTFAQILGLFKSLHLGYQPDNPCPSGEINRVVQNVKIYGT